MPDTRYALRNGDKTSTSGVLVATGRSVFHHDTTIGVEGDYATCPVCKAGGPVMNDCYPAFDIGGKQVLVSGAHVYCRCQPKPVVLPSQNDFTIEVNRLGRSIATNPGPSTILGETSHTGSHKCDELIVLVDEDGYPVPHQRYKITTENGWIHEGMTNEAGEASRISTDGPSKLTIELV